MASRRPDIVEVAEEVPLGKRFHDRHAGRRFSRCVRSPSMRSAMSNHPTSGEPRDGDVIVNGIRLHYLDWGGHGAPIVLLHATGFLGPIYRPIAQALTAIGRVYSFDQRGHGDSERPRNDIYGWDITAGDLEGFILAMGFEHVRAIGHSAGATAIGVVASG